MVWGAVGDGEVRGDGIETRKPRRSGARQGEAITKTRSANYKLSRVCGWLYRPARN